MAQELLFKDSDTEDQDANDLSQVNPTLVTSTTFRPKHEVFRSDSQNFWEEYKFKVPIVFYRNQKKGIGDIISTLSAVQALKKKYPQATIHYQTYDHFFPLLDDHPDIDKLIDIRSPLDSGMIIDLSTACSAFESKKLTESGVLDESRNEIFTLASHLEYDREKPKLYFSHFYRNRALELIQDNPNSNGIIGLVLQSAERWKDYPYNELLCEMLLKKGFTVYTLDKTKTLKLRHPNLIPITDLILKDLVAFVSLLDLVISPDTGTLHIAEALNVNSIGIFGSMGMKRRAFAYKAPTTYYIAKDVCGRSPCYYQRCKGLNQYQPCMSAIHPQEIINRIEIK